MPVPQRSFWPVEGERDGPAVAVARLRAVRRERCFHHVGTRGTKQKCMKTGQSRSIASVTQKYTGAAEEGPVPGRSVGRQTVRLRPTASYHACGRPQRPTSGIVDDTRNVRERPHTLIGARDPALRLQDLLTTPVASTLLNQVGSDADTSKAIGGIPGSSRKRKKKVADAVLDATLVARRVQLERIFLQLDTGAAALRSCTVSSAVRSPVSLPS
jgi:hypothetical protein